MATEIQKPPLPRLGNGHNSLIQDTLKEAFLVALTQHSNEADAAAAVGVDPSTPWNWKKQDLDFAERWETSLKVQASRWKRNLGNLADNTDEARSSNACFQANRLLLCRAEPEFKEGGTNVQVNIQQVEAIEYRIPEGG